MMNRFECIFVMSDSSQLMKIENSFVQCMQIYLYYHRQASFDFLGTNNFEINHFHTQKQHTILNL